MEKWHNFSKKKPVVSRFGVSQHLLCLKDRWSVPFVGYYNSNGEIWRISLFSTI